MKNPNYDQFAEDYRKRFNQEPDVFSVHSYDAMNITIDAIRKAGLNRTIIRDLLTDMETFQNYKGASGEIIFDATWNDVGQIYSVEIKDDNFIYTPFKSGKQELTGSIK